MPKPTRRALPADIQKPSARRRWSALADVPVGDSRPLSIQVATRYPVADIKYTSQEVEAAEHAMDFNGTSLNALSFVGDQGFPGFPTLSLLAQLPEYRTMHETLADECIRMWGKVKSSGNTDPHVIAAIEAQLVEHDVRAVIRQAVIDDQRFGRSHVYFKLRGDETGRDLPLTFARYGIRKNSLQGFRNVEAYWTTPNFYNSIDPTAADFYKPSSWWMLGVQTHATRLQTIVSRPVPDMLKPAYSFAGVSMSQLAMPYVDNWLRTRQSVSDTVKQFSVSGVRTDMQQYLAPGGATDLQYRAQLLNAYRDNRNILFLDMATEEFFQINTPLSGLDALQAQAQEQQAAVSHIPLVKLLGITPNGLNASSEGEIRTWNDYVHGYQTNVLSPVMVNILKAIQLSAIGKIDPTLTWDWTPLLELTELEAADVRAKDADTAGKYVEMQAITAENVAAKLAADPNSGYSGIVEDGETIETTPDADIAQITQHILDIGGGPAMPEDDELGIEGEVPLAGFPAGITGAEGLEAEPQTGSGGTGGPDEYITDPSAQVDPGALEEPDLQRAQ